MGNCEMKKTIKCPFLDFNLFLRKMKIEIRSRACVVHFLFKKELMSVILYTIVKLLTQEEFDNTKELIRIRISKKIRQHNDKKKKHKKANNDLQNIHIKLKIE